MLLEDILAITSEHVKVEIYDTENNLLSFYDGKNSIDIELNTCEVVQIETIGKILAITILTEE